MHEFFLALFGGALIGISVVGYLYINGKIVGISGMIAQLLTIHHITKSPALWFLLGVFFMPFLYQSFFDPAIKIESSPILLMISGLFVGFGTRMGAGCTSGHGICGVSRLSSRSIVATLTFMSIGIMTVFVMRHMLGV